MMSGQKVSHAKLEYEILCKTFEEEAELFAFFMKENYIARFKLVSDPIRFLEGGPIYYLYKDKTIGVCTPKYCINNKGITVENFKKIYYNMKNERPVSLTYETAKKMYESNDTILKDIAIKTFPELLSKNYPKSWKELGIKKSGDHGFCLDTYGMITISKFKYDKCDSYLNTVSTVQRCQRLLLLGQLLEIRDEWNRMDNFIPYENKDIENYIIYLRKNPATLNIATIVSTAVYQFAFKTNETAELFMTTFHDMLIEVLSL